LRIWPARLLAPIAGAGLALAAPASAQGEDPPKPVTDDTITAGDVAVTPIEDLNLKKDKIPQLLLDAQQDPYSTEGLKRCAQYAAAVSELDVILGPDFDIATADQRRVTAGSVAKSVVGSFIPFRGVIREISGANKHEQEFRDAIVAGVMRRAFLKGMGLKLGCAYPARPADDDTRFRLAREALDAQEAKKAEAAAKDKDKDENDRPGSAGQ